MLDNKLREDLERLKKIVLTEVCDTIGVFVYVVNTPKQLDVVDELLVYQRRNKCYKLMDLYVRNTLCCMRINSDKMNLYKCILCSRNHVGTLKEYLLLPQ